MSSPTPSPTRDDAWALLCEWTQGEQLRKNGLAVEAAVAWYGANRFGIGGAELEIWRAAGLLHDFDYGRYPETHPLTGSDELRRKGYPDELVEAVLGHGDHTGVVRTSLLARTVYACDISPGIAEWSRIARSGFFYWGKLGGLAVPGEGGGFRAG